MIVYGAILGDGNAHDPDDLPTLLAGRGGGTIDSGRAIEFAEPTDLANLHLSLLQRDGGADRPLREQLDADARDRRVIALGCLGGSQRRKPA